MWMGQLGSNTFWILMITVHLSHCVVVSPMSSEKKKTVQTTTVKDVYDENEFFKTFWLKKNNGLCPFGQVPQRNKTVCCYVTSCGPGNEIKECTKNGTEDECSPCQPGFMQFNNVSSLNMEEAKCFPEISNHENCPIQSMRPYRKELDLINFPYPCECLIDKCFVKNTVGDCDQKDACDSNFQMSRTSRKCEECPWYAYKFERGCQPCTINETLIRQGRPKGNYIPPNLRTTTEPVETIANVDINENQLSEAPDTPVTDFKGDNGNMTVNLTALLTSVIALILLALVVVGVVYFACKRRTRGQSTRIPPSTPTNDSAPLLNGQGFSGIGPIQNINGYGNTLYQQYQHTPTPVDGEQPWTFPNGNTLNGHGGNIPVNGAISRIGNGFSNVVEHSSSALLEGHGTSGESSNNNHEVERTQNAPSDSNERAKESNNNVRMIERNFREVGVKVRYANESEKGCNEIKTETENLCGAEGGADDCNEKDNNMLEDVINYSQETKKKNAYTHVCIRNNNIENMYIHINGKEKCKGKSRSRSNEGVIMEEENVSSVSDSTISTGLSLSPTLPVRNIEQNINDPVADSNKREVASNVVAIEDGAESKEPPCRPELSYVASSSGQGCDAIIDDDKRGEKAMGNASVKRPNNIVKPLQSSATGIDRQIARVVPMRQNSEVRHMSGYPSLPINDEERYNDVSMSYAFLHADSELDTGFIRQSHDVANDDLSSIDYNGNSNNPSYMSNSMSLSGRQVQHPVDVNGQTENLNRGVNRSGQQIGERGVGVTMAVQPMGEREAPEGSSIVYGPENDDDMQQTYRKVIANEFDLDSTNEKQMMYTDTQTEVIDTDDDLTLYKRKVMENQTDEIYPNVEEKEGKEKSKHSICEGSINKENEMQSKAKYNVENILYEEDSLTGGDKSSEQTDEREEKSFELESIDVRNMKIDYKAADEVAEDDETSKSFEIRSEDIKMLHKVNNEVESVKSSGDIAFPVDHNNDVVGKQTEESFELDRFDIEQVRKEGEISRLENDRESYIDNRTCSRESSFEIDPAEILDIKAPENTDIPKACDRQERDE